MSKISIKQKEKKMSTNKFISYVSMYLAIFIVMSIVPFIGYINIGIIKITLMVFPLTVMTIHLGWKGALLGGLFFGTGSMMNFAINGSTILTMIGGSIGKLFTIVWVGRILVGTCLALIIFFLDRWNILNFFRSIINMFINIINFFKKKQKGDSSFVSKKEKYENEKSKIRMVSHSVIIAILGLFFNHVAVLGLIFAFGGLESAIAMVTLTGINTAVEWPTVIILSVMVSPLLLIKQRQTHLGY